MFDIGWTELLVIGVVALIVVGPKDLPEMFRTLGRFTAKAKSMAREFTRAMETAADEAGVKDLTKDLKGMTSAKNLGLNTIKDAATSFENWDPTKKSDPKTKKGPATEALTEERAETARKIQEATAKKATERLAKEAKAVENRENAAKPAAKKAAPKSSPVKTTTAKKPAAKKPAAKAVPAKKTATKKSPAKAASNSVPKPVAKTGAPKRPAPKRSAAKASEGSSK